MKQDWESFCSWPLASYQLLTSEKPKELQLIQIIQGILIKFLIGWFWHEIADLKRETSKNIFHPTSMRDRCRWKLIFWPSWKELMIGKGRERGKRLNCVFWSHQDFHCYKREGEKGIFITPPSFSGEGSSHHHHDWNLVTSIWVSFVSFTFPLKPILQP